MSKAKKLSLPSAFNADLKELFNYKPKDLIWAKMKGFTPWPAMIVEAPIDLLSQPRKHNSKCVFFFGSRNFAWIETNNMKPYEGAWKNDLSKVAKPNSFRQAISDIEAYLVDTTEIDGEIAKATGVNHSTEADFDKIRDGLDSSYEEQILDDDTATPEIITNDDIHDVLANDNGVVLDAGDLSVNNEEITASPPFKASPVKRVPKAKATAKAKTTVAKSATKRRRTSQVQTAAKRKRNASTGLEDVDYAPIRDLDASEVTPSTAAAATPSRRKINTEALAHIGGSTRRNMNSIALLNRPIVSRPEAQTIDMNTRSQTLLERDITPSELIFGFLGLGIMGSTIVKDLLCTGHKVVVWNRTQAKTVPFAHAGAEVKNTPMDVVEAADIIFCCVSDPKASKDLVFGNCGVLQHKDLCNKAYVEMSTIDPETSQDISEGIEQCNGRYLEVQIHGTRQEAEDGMLIILAGGDRTVFEECHSCFKTIAKNTFFLGAEVGNACKVNLILQTIAGVSLVGLAEALALADRFSISLKDIIDIYELTSMKSELLLAKGKEMAKGDFNPQQPLSHMQKDLRLVLSMAENLDQSMPVTAITNEVFKHTKRLGYSEHDSSAVFKFSKNSSYLAQIVANTKQLPNSQSKCTTPVKKVMEDLSAEVQLQTVSTISKQEDSQVKEKEEVQEAEHRAQEQEKYEEAEEVQKAQNQEDQVQFEIKKTHKKNAEFIVVKLNDDNEVEATYQEVGANEKDIDEIYCERNSARIW